MVKMEKQPIDWITVNGNHVPIFEGQSKKDTISSFIKDKSPMQKDKSLLSGAGSEGRDTSVEIKLRGKKEPQYYNKSNGRNAIENVIQKLKTFEGKEEGTYDYITGERIGLTDGYMVTFHQNEPDEHGHYKSHYGRYTEEEYDRLANEFAQNYNAKVYVGVFDNEPEISFKVETEEDALELMLKYEQDSIWNNYLGSIGDYDGALIKNTKRNKKVNPLRGE